MALMWLGGVSWVKRKQKRLWWVCWSVTFLIMLSKAPNKPYTKRNLAQIIATRKRTIKTKHSNLLSSTAPQPLRASSSLKTSELSDPIGQLQQKTVFKQEDKNLAIKHVEKQYRILFEPQFPPNNFEIISIDSRARLEKSYDPQKRSYYVIKGALLVSQKIEGATSAENQLGMTFNSLRQTQWSGEDNGYKQVSRFEVRQGTGVLFGNDLSAKKMSLFAQSSLLLRVRHEPEDLETVQTNCVMTSQQKQTAVAKFPLFEDTDTLNKFYTPFFKTRKFHKGDFIYNAEDEPQYLYLVVEGTVQLQAVLNRQQEGDKPMYKKVQQKNILVPTLTLGPGTHFGEEEIVSPCQRKQSVTCFSEQVVLLMMPQNKVERLLFHNHFRGVLQASSEYKQEARRKQTEKFKEVRGLETDSSKEHLSYLMNYDQLTQHIYQHCHAAKIEASPKQSAIPLRPSKPRILHGSKLGMKGSRSIKPKCFSMLEVNQHQYQQSAKKFALHPSKKLEPQRYDKKKQARSMEQIWKALNLQNVLTQQNKLGLSGEGGMESFNSHMRLTNRINHSKSYRPKSSSTQHSRLRNSRMGYVNSML